MSLSEYSQSKELCCCSASHSQRTGNEWTMWVVGWFK